MTGESFPEIDLNKRYARVDHGEIKESYVSGLHIKNRGHSPALYYEVIEQPKPSINKFQNHKEALTVNEGSRQVVASYVAVDKDVDEVLRELHESRMEKNDEAVFDSGDMFANWPDIILSTVDQDIVDYVLNKVKAYSATRLDSFARTREYDGIISLCTYATSTVEKFRVEGQRGVDLRDQSYAALYQYLEAMLTGAEPVPKSLSDVEAKLPVLTWQ